MRTQHFFVINEFRTSLVHVGIVDTNLHSIGMFHGNNFDLVGAEAAVSARDRIDGKLADGRKQESVPREIMSH